MNQLNIHVIPGNRDITVNRGTRLIDAIEQASVPQTNENGYRWVAARVGNVYTSLLEPLKVSCTVECLTRENTEGMRIYRKTLIFLFEMASRRLFPDKSLIIGHALGHGFYHRFKDNAYTGTEEDAEKLQKEIQKLIDRKLPIQPGLISWQEAVDYFDKKGHAQTVKLLEELNQSEVPVWHCAEDITLRHYPLAPNTDLVDVFAVNKYKQGFILRYPSTSNPAKLPEPDYEPKLFNVYEENKRWGEILEVSNVTQLNALSRNRETARDFIQTAEALHDRKIGEMTGFISQKRDTVKTILIAGPSSSGKTTFTKKLALSLRSAGLKPQLISLDDYYRERNDIPLDEEGKPDFEVLEALDLPLFNQNLSDLLAGKEVEIPVFDFKKVGGRLPEGRRIHLDKDGVLLFEGIHGLNPSLTPSLDSSQTFRIYISALTQLNLDDHNRIPTTDNRLIRRIVRDHQFRQYPAINTLRMWPSVRRGEEKHIFPYQGSADVMFNSALDYELAVLKVFAQPLLRTVSPREPEYAEARRLLSFLKFFSPFPVEEVPELSIIREFLGRSGFHY